MPLPTVVAETLAAHISEFAPAEDGSLFTTTSGNLFRQEHFGARVFKPAVESAGLRACVTSHDLRHHYASLGYRWRVRRAVAERLGHRSDLSAQTTALMQTARPYAGALDTALSVTSHRRPKPWPRCSASQGRFAC